MSSVNKVILVGRIGQEPDLKYTAKGEAAVNLSLATSERWKDKATSEQKELTEWHRISLFGKQAEIAGQYIKKGSMLYVEGKIRSKKYTDKQGIERVAFEIIAENFKMLGGKSDDSAPKQMAKPSAKQEDNFQDLDVPF